MITATKTLSDLYTDADAFAAAFPDIDEPTAQALYRSFFWKTVCDDDMFNSYVISFWDKNSQSYYDDLKIQLTRFDPMVTKYMERQIKHLGKDVEDTDNTLTHGLISTTTHGHTRTMTHGLTTTMTHGLQKTLSHGEKITRGGDDTVNTQRVQTQTSTTTDTIATRSTDGNGTSAGIGASDSRALAASLPRVDTYSANGINAPAAIDADVDGSGTTASGIVVGGLDWRNADSQSETVGANSSKGKTTSHSKTSVDGDDVSKTVLEYTGDPDTQKTLYDSYDQHSGDDVEKNEGDDIQKNEGDDVEKNEGDDKVANSGNDKNVGKKTTTYDSKNRERYTGRDGNPAELLSRARDYVQRTGAFKRLCNQFEVCFYPIYED